MLPNKKFSTRSHLKKERYMKYNETQAREMHSDSLQFSHTRRTTMLVRFANFREPNNLDNVVGYRDNGNRCEISF